MPLPPVRYIYQTFEIGDRDVHVRTLRDANQFADDDGEAEDLGISSAIWPLFGVVWDSGRALATLMLDQPVANLRILEVGCGIGLASLVLNQRDADITATDQHPETGRFLDVNTKLNDDRDIPFVRADWVGDEPSLGTFDLIIGSDLLYETGQVDLLSRFIEAHAKKTCTVLIVDPGRGQANRFDREMLELGYASDRVDAETIGDDRDLFRGTLLRYRR